MEGISSSLRQELSPFGVDVVLIRPGAIKTEWSGSLEGNALPQSGMASMLKKVEAIRQAQDTGAVSKRYAPEMLMLMIHALTRLGAPGSPEAESGLIPKDAFRQSIGAAVARLVAP